MSETLRLSDEFRRSAGAAAKTFHERISPETAEYLASRGIFRDAIERFKFGTVDGSVSGYFEVAGMVSIPYRTPRGGVCALKFRRAHACTDACEHPKYLTTPGHESRLYNTTAFDRADESGTIAICEGEFDAAVLDFYCHIPAVAVPGVTTWKQHREWPSLFRGYTRVLVFQDEDEKGKELAKAIVKEIDTAEIVSLSPYKDVTEAYLDLGSDEIRMIARA